MTSSLSIRGCVLKGCFERGIVWRAKSRLKGIEDFNLEHCGKGSCCFHGSIPGRDSSRQGWQWPRRLAALYRHLAKVSSGASVFCPTWFLGGLQPLHRNVFEFSTWVLKLGGTIKDLQVAGKNKWVVVAKLDRGMGPRAGICTISGEFMMDSFVFGVKLSALPICIHATLSATTACNAQLVNVWGDLWA